MTDLISSEINTFTDKGVHVCGVSPFNLVQVNQVLSTMASNAEIDAMSAIFRAASEPLRAKILSALLEADELCVCDISCIAGASQSAVSRQLRFLRDHRIVTPRKAAQLVFYSLKDECIRELLRLCLRHVRHSSPTQTEEVPANG